ncbi:amino acid ABC transporter ATP-binding protein [Corynebacterium sp. A21]|uniref:amino acid ABC transporter ATP-binding protein n=1 Tax=Corynebacterium sp. A21 TaxID=3457318 RepID=UPI003FD4CDED
MSESQHPTHGRVELTDILKRFGDNEVLKKVSLTVEPGEVTVIIGPSGSGKSTLLRTINRLEGINGGMVRIDDEIIGYRQEGRSLFELSEKELLKQRLEVGMVFQSFNLFGHMTVLRNITESPIRALGMSKSEAEARARRLLERVGLSDKADAYPRQLSGGQQQRVAIARALALQPKVLLFDEPTSALDPELVDEVLNVIRGLADEGTTLIVVTHEMAFARDVADTVVFMDAGEIVEQGSPAQLFNNPVQDRTKKFLSAISGHGGQVGEV